MDVVIKSVVLIFLLADLAILMPQQNFSASKNDFDIDANDIQRNCTTGKGIEGSCVLRRYCDFGTIFIDLTLYAPNEYVRPCHEKEACCPFGSQLPMQEKNLEDDASFEFNEND